MDCLSCTPGSYCEGFGNFKPTNTCSAGFYCPGGDSDAKAFRCKRGHFCPVGSYNMTKCTPGKYCDEEGLAAPKGPCDPGYYCPLGSSVRTQIECPEGNYCPLGSAVPEPCQPGTFLPGRRHQNISECQPCTAGEHCNKTGLAATDGKCDKGYYCPPGQSISTPAPYPCPVGHYCLVGSPLPTRCENGTYQDSKYSFECKDCEAGYYCDNTNMAVSSLAAFGCPMGHYCPRKTRFATQHKCPPGTWSNKTKLEREDQCTPCPPK